MQQIQCTVEYIILFSYTFFIAEEIVKLENELKIIIPEAGAKVNLEVEKVKTMYKDKLRKANVDIEYLRTVSRYILEFKTN